jgi:hypothetical protein
VTVSDTIMGAEAHWLMGRVMPREFLEEVGKYLHHVAPGREDGLMAANFMKAIDPSVSGLGAERTSLLSLGDSQCRFAVLETDNPLAGYTDKLDERFAGKQQSG